METMAKKRLPKQPYTVKIGILSLEERHKYPAKDVKFNAFLKIPGNTLQGTTDIEVYLDGQLNLSVLQMIKSRYPVVYDIVSQHVYEKTKLKKLIEAIRLLYDVRLR